MRFLVAMSILAATACAFSQSTDDSERATSNLVVLRKLDPSGIEYRCPDGSGYYFSIKEMLVDGGTSESLSVNQNGIDVFAASRLTDCSDESAQCLKTAQLVLAIPRRPVQQGEVFRVVEHYFRVAACLEDSCKNFEVQAFLAADSAEYDFQRRQIEQSDEKLITMPFYSVDTEKGIVSVSSARSPNQEASSRCKLIGARGLFAPG